MQENDFYLQLPSTGDHSLLILWAAEGRGLSTLQIIKGPIEFESKDELSRINVLMFRLCSEGVSRVLQHYLNWRMADRSMRHLSNQHHRNRWSAITPPHTFTDNNGHQAGWFWSVCWSHWAAERMRQTPQKMRLGSGDKILSESSRRPTASPCKESAMTEHVGLHIGPAIRIHPERSNRFWSDLTSCSIYK